MTLPTYQVAGDGPRLVLLNGGMMTHAGWLPIATVLEQHFEVLRFDFRGQLLSPASEEAPSPGDLAGHARDVEALLDEQGWDDAHLVGTSFGALVALELAAGRPQRARSLVLVAVADYETDDFREGSKTSRRILRQILEGPEDARAAAREAFHEHLKENVFSAGYVSRHADELQTRKAQLGAVPEYWFAGVDALVGMLEGFDLRPKLGSVDCPVLVMTAENDRVMPPERSAELARTLGAEHVVHAQSGHAVVTEDPHWVAKQCLEFLRELEDD